MASTEKGVSDLKIDPVMEKPWQRAKRFEKYEYYNKSAYPPMQLEPFIDERSRLAGEGMTPEQRALRKQWVQDQILHHERRIIPETQPYNIFRRIYRWPADVLIYKPLYSRFGHNVADPLRYVMPKIVMMIIGSYFVYYHLKYNQKTWTRNSGFFTFRGKPVLLGNEAHEYPERTDFYDLGFKSRKVLLYKEK